MPKYGGKRSTDPETIIIRKKGTGLITKKDSRQWEVKNTPLRIVNKNLDKRLTIHIEELLKKKEHPVIFEWGSDSGRALLKLAKKYPTAIFIGSSRESHSKWNKRPKNVTFLHTTEEGIERLANKKSSSQKVDLIFSHFGVGHIIGRKKYADSKDRMRFLNHFTKLKNSLTIGGKIMIIPQELRIRKEDLVEFIKNLEKRGFLVKIGFKENDVGIIELIRVK